MNSKILIALVAFLLLIGGVFIFVNIYGARISSLLVHPTSQVTIDNKTFPVTLAQTEAEKTTGLSNRTSLPKDEGMLFIFPKPDYYAFWMKNMKFSLDILFMKNSKIVTIFHNVPTPKPNTSITQLPIYKPTQPADKVLELNAGVADTNHLHVGDTVSFKL